MERKSRETGKGKELPGETQNAGEGLERVREKERAQEREKEKERGGEKEKMLGK